VSCNCGTTEEKRAIDALIIAWSLPRPRLLNCWSCFDNNGWKGECIKDTKPNFTTVFEQYRAPLEELKRCFLIIVIWVCPEHICWDKDRFRVLYHATTQNGLLNPFLKCLVLVFIETLSILLQASMSEFSVSYQVDLLILNSDFKTCLLSRLGRFVFIFIRVILIQQTKHSTKGGERSGWNKAGLLLRLPGTLIIKLFQLFIYWGWKDFFL